MESTTNSTKIDYDLHEKKSGFFEPLLISTFALLFIGALTVEIFWTNLIIPSTSFTLVLALLGSMAASKNGRHLGIHILPFITNMFVKRFIVSFNAFISFIVFALLLFSISANIQSELKTVSESTLSFLSSSFVIIALLIMNFRFASWAIFSMELSTQKNSFRIGKNILIFFVYVFVFAISVLCIYYGWFKNSSITDAAASLRLSPVSPHFHFFTNFHSTIIKLFGSFEKISQLLKGNSSSFLGRISPFGWGIFCILFMGLFTGVPVFIFIAGLSTLLYSVGDSPIEATMNEFLRLKGDSQTTTIFIFIIFGYILNSGQGIKRIMHVWENLLGWLPGNEVIATVLACSFLSATTGGSGITILILGGFFYKRLVTKGYSELFSAGLISTAGGLGLLLPPSIPIFIYSLVNQQTSYQKLFLGGALPSLFMLSLVIFYGLLHGFRRKITTVSFDGRKFLQSLWIAKWDLLLPVLLFYIVLTGKATQEKTAALGVVLAIIIETIIHRTLHPYKKLPKVVFEAVAIAGAIFLIYGISKSLNNSLMEFLMNKDGNIILNTWVTDTSPSKWKFLLFINVVLLFLGGALEMYGALFLFITFLAPLANLLKESIHPVHMAIIFFANMEVGFILPPLGLNVLLAALYLKKPITFIYRSVLPFLLVMFIGLMGITYYEPFTTWMLKLFNAH